MTMYGLPVWYVVLTDVAWYASRLWLRLLALFD